MDNKKVYKVIKKEKSKVFSAGFIYILSSITFAIALLLLIFRLSTQDKVSGLYIIIMLSAGIIIGLISERYIKVKKRLDENIKNITIISKSEGKNPISGKIHES